MPRYGVSVEKATSFRGATQQFANVYHYEGAIPPEANTSLENLLDQIVAIERPLHSTGISFVRGRVWSTGLGQAQNNMIVDKTLTGTGGASVHGTMDRERAFLVRFRAGSDSRGRPVYLRKWWHLDCSLIGGSAISATALQQTAELLAGQRAAMVTFANSLKQLSVSGTPMDLVAQTGRQITGATEAHRFLEHHQLGDEWRTV